MKAFLRTLGLIGAVLLGSAIITQAADVFYNVGLYDVPMAVDRTNLGTDLQFGTSVSVPVHIGSAQLTAPVLSACGTSPSIVGTDESGTVTMGTGTPTGCVITFTQPYQSAPNCVVNWVATPLASQSYAVSTTAITLTQTATSSNKAAYICRAVAGG